MDNFASEMENIAKMLYKHSILLTKKEVEDPKKKEELESKGYTIMRLEVFNDVQNITQEDIEESKNKPEQFIALDELLTKFLMERNRMINGDLKDLDKDTKIQRQLSLIKELFKD